MTTSSNKQTLGTFVKAGLIGGAIALVINFILYFIGNTINGEPLSIQQPGTTAIQALPIFGVITFSLVPGLIAGALYGILKRFSSRARVIFLVIAAVIFILMFFGPPNAAQSTVTLWVLLLMHIGTAAPVIAMLLRADR
jgi:hypothetical protein